MCIYIYDNKGRLKLSARKPTKRCNKCRECTFVHVLQGTTSYVNRQDGSVEYTLVRFYSELA